MWPIDSDHIESVVHRDTVMADSPGIGNEQAAGLHRLALPILPDGSALQFSDGVRGPSNAANTIAPP